MRSVPTPAKPGRPDTARPLQSTVIVSFVSIPPLDIAKTHWILTRRTPRPSASQDRENRSRYCRCLLGWAFGPRNFVKKRWGTLSSRVAHALLRAASALLPTPAAQGAEASSETRRSTQECVRHICQSVFHEVSRVEGPSQQTKASVPPWWGRRTQTGPRPPPLSSSSSQIGR